jgi:PAS domain-containing protein
MMVEAAFGLGDAKPVRPLVAIVEPIASAWLASGIRPAELVHALLEAEQLLDRLVFDEAGTAPPDPAQWRVFREGLRDVMRFLSERLTPVDAERERRRLTGLLEVLPEAILLVDADERVSYANCQVRDAYGVDPASIVGRSLADVLTEPALLLRLENAEEFLDATLRLLDSSDEPYEDVFRQIDGSAFVRRSLPAGPDGRLVLTTNVTRLRRRNQEVERQETASCDQPPFGPSLRRGTSSGLRLLQGGRSD